MGLGCGNPQALAALQPDETVLGSGSGSAGDFDCFRARRQGGPNGRAIGVDMTPDMVSKARANAAPLGARNVEFRLGEIEHLPGGHAQVDGRRAASSTFARQGGGVPRGVPGAATRRPAGDRRCRAPSTARTAHLAPLTRAHRAGAPNRVMLALVSSVSWLATLPKHTNRAQKMMQKLQLQQTRRPREEALERPRP